MSSSFPSRCFACFLRLFPFLLFPLAAVAADSSELLRQREQFPLVWETAKHGPDGAWRRLASGLESYPLYPYLELAALQHQMQDVQRAQVDKFIGTWPDSLPARTLREAFLPELAKRQDWKNFLALSSGMALNKELQCDALQARLTLGPALDFKTDIAPLWLSASALPTACDAVVSWAKEHGNLTATVVWERIDLAAAAGHGDLIAALASLLDGAEREAAQRMATAVRDPASALTQATDWPDGPRTRAAITLAFERLARRNSDLAETFWTKSGSQFHFDAEQRGRVLRALALYRATAYAPDARARLSALPADLADDATREWRTRLALAAQDWKDALNALDAMPSPQKDDPRWRYTLARVLVKLGQQERAAPLFTALAREANFHGFLAADWLQQPYMICPAAFPDNGALAAKLRQLPGLSRAFEFFALNDLPEARREWDFALQPMDAQQRRLAANLASELGWYDRAVYTFTQGDDLHFYDLRFPLPRRAQITRDATAAGVDPAWAYAIIRAESAWTSDARSGADAYGLMQLLPGTARQLAKALKLPYAGARDLFNADTNIALGTHYLGNMALHYDGSQWLASAAYNAGADPVGRWIDARDRLEPDFFIETIPYKETREYIARVLAFSVIYDWRLHGSVLPLSSRMPRIGQAYTLPGPDAPRKAVVSPASAEAVAATPSTSPEKPQ
jgi:soluble lytic murein transglycosylase